MAIEIITDHVERGQGLLLQQFKAKPDIRAFVGFLLRQVQDLEDAAFAVLISRRLDNATGAQLDILGELVGCSRTSLDDETYRLAIRLQIFINNSSGTPPELARILQEFTGADSVEYILVPPAGYRLRVVGGELSDGLLEIMQTLTIGGVEIYGIHRNALRPFQMGDHINQGLLVEEE